MKEMLLKCILKKNLFHPRGPLSTSARELTVAPSHKSFLAPEWQDSEVTSLRDSNPQPEGTLTPTAAGRNPENAEPGDPRACHCPLVAHSTKARPQIRKALPEPRAKVGRARAWLRGWGKEGKATPTPRVHCGSGRHCLNLKTEWFPSCSRLPGSCHAAGEEPTLVRVAACPELLRLRHRGRVSVDGLVTAGV